MSLKIIASFPYISKIMHIAINSIKATSKQFFRAAVAQPAECSASDRRSCVQGSLGKTPPCTLMASAACKIRRGSNVLQVTIQIIPLGVPKRERHPLPGGSKLRWHVSGSYFEMNLRPSAIAH